MNDRRYSHRIERILLVLCLFSIPLGLMLFFPQPSPVQAAAITVNTLGDDNTVNGNCTLREAILAANTNAAVDTCTSGAPGLDTITFNVTGKYVGGTFTATDTFAKKDTLIARIHVVDQNGANLSGATVSFTVKKPNGTAQCTLSATTDAGGTAENSCTIPSGPNGTWDIHVDNVTKAGYSYDAANSVTDHNFTVQ